MKKIVIVVLLGIFTLFAGCGGGSGSGGSGGSNNSSGGIIATELSPSSLPAASSKAITSFSLNGFPGTIDETAKTITVNIPYSYGLTNLVATYTTSSDSVKVGSTVQTSGVTANDFTTPVIYTLTMADDSIQEYAVTVTATTSSEDKWTQKADFKGGTRMFATGFSIGNKGYIGTSEFVNDFWEYDPETNLWTQKADFGGTLRNGAAGFSIGSKGYIGTGLETYSYVPLKDFWEYDPATNTWAQKADFAGDARWSATGFSVNGKGYIGTGQNLYAVLKDFWEYDPATDTWTRKADLGDEERWGATGFSIGSKGYIGLGIKDVELNYFNDFWEYDPSTNAWTRKADFGGTSRGGAVGFSIGSKGYVGTGGHTTSAFRDFWEYDPAANAWTRKADFGGDEVVTIPGFTIKEVTLFGFLPIIGGMTVEPFTVELSARGGAVGFSIGGKGYIGTGGFWKMADDFWEYSP